MKIKKNAAISCVVTSGTIQYNSQGNRPIHHQHIIHSSFSAQMMQSRNFDGLFVLALIRNKTCLENKKLCLLFCISEIPSLCYQHGSKVLNMLITTWWNQRLHPNSIFSKFVVSNWDKDQADIHCISKLFCFGLMIIQELIEGSVDLDQLPAVVWSSHLTLERSLRLKNTACLNTTLTYPQSLVVFWSSMPCWLHLHGTCSALLLTKWEWRWTRIVRNFHHLDMMEMKL